MPNPVDTLPVSLPPHAPIEVELWSWSLDQETLTVVAAEDLLNEDERARAMRFVKDVDRRRYIVGRAGLRRVLASCLQANPRDLHFGYNAWGKPMLGANHQAGLHFNLSHSAGEAVLAVSAHADLGVDIEEIRPLQEDIASHFFSSTECAELAAFPEPERLAAFYRCWTRKEAFVKAHGAGLSVPLQSFDVSLSAKNRHGLLKRVDEEIASIDLWEIANLDVADGFCGALAVRCEGRELKVRYRNRLPWSANMASIT